jgi:hypothetical protein
MGPELAVGAVVEPAERCSDALALAVANAFARVRRVASDAEDCEERVLCSLLAAAREGGVRAALDRCGELVPEPRCVKMLVPVFAARETEVDASLSGALCGRRLNDAIFAFQRKPASMVLTTGLTLIGCLGFILGLCGLVGEQIMLFAAVVSSLVYIPTVAMWSSLVCRLLLLRFEAWFAVFNIGVACASMSVIFSGIPSVACCIFYSLAVPLGLLMDACPFRKQLWPGMLCGTSYLLGTSLLLSLDMMVVQDVRVSLLGSYLSLRNRAIGAQINLGLISLNYFRSSMMCPERYCLLQGTRMTVITRQASQRLLRANRVLELVRRRSRSSRDNEAPEPAGAKQLTALREALSDTLRLSEQSQGESSDRELRKQVCKELDALLDAARLRRHELWLGTGNGSLVGDVVPNGDSGVPHTSSKVVDAGVAVASAGPCMTGSSTYRNSIVRYISPTFRSVTIDHPAMPASRATVAYMLGWPRLAEVCAALGRSPAFNVLGTATWVLGLGCTTAALLDAVPVALALCFVSLASLVTLQLVAVAHAGICVLAMKRFLSVFYSGNVIVVAVAGFLVLGSTGAKWLWLYAHTFFSPRVLFTDALPVPFHVKLRGLFAYAAFNFACSAAFWCGLWTLEASAVEAGPLSARNVFFSALINIAILSARFFMRALVDPHSLVVISGVARVSITEDEMNRINSIARDETSLLVAISSTKIRPVQKTGHVASAST